MSERNDGGSAFPRYEEFAQFDEDLGKYVDTSLPVEGMSLRDYFAAKAMAAVDREMWVAMCHDAPSSKRTPFEECAAHCYQMADAMLKAREVK